MDWSPFAVGGAAARSDSFTGLNPDFAESVYRMVQDAHAAGIPLQITSAYRSPEVQARLYDAALKKYGSPAAARKWVAPPGRSQHNHGTAVDFAVNGSLIRDANSQEAQWIKANSAKYGLDVPMSWEPWQVEMAGARGQKPRETLSTNSPAVATAGLALTPSLIPGMDQEAPQMEPETAGGLLGMLFPDMGADRADQIRLGINGMLHNPNTGMQRSIEARMGERAQGRERQEQAAQAQQQANKTIAAMRHGGAPDYLIAAAEAGQVMPALQEFLKLRAAQMQGQEPANPRTQIAKLQADLNDDLINQEQYQMALEGIAAKDGMAIEFTPDGGFSYRTGAATDTKPLTEGQSKDTTYATRAEGALPILDQFDTELASFGQQALNADPTGVVRSRLQSPKYQKAQQAGDEFLQAILRKDTGAAITADEQVLYGRTYLPQPGDGPDVIQQKRMARSRALAALKAGMPPAAIIQQEKALAQSGGQASAMDFSNMSAADLSRVDVMSLNPEQLRALQQRFDELGL